MSSEAVSQAIGSVKYSSSGSASFNTQTEADEFIDEVYLKFPAIGYGTVARIDLHADKFQVNWRVYSAD